MEPTGFNRQRPENFGRLGGLAFRSQPCVPDSSSRPVRIKRAALRLEPNCVARYRTSNGRIENRGNLGPMDLRLTTE